MSLTKVSYSMIQGEYLSVLDFGADPTATTDSSAAFQAAIDEAYTARKSIYVPTGGYLIADTLVCNTNTVLVGEYGQNNFGATLYWAPAAPSNSTMLEVKSNIVGETYAHHVFFGDLTVMHQNGSPDFDKCVLISDAYNITFRNVRFHDIRANAIVSVEDEANNVRFEDCIFYGDDSTGKQVKAVANDGLPSNTVFITNCDTEACHYGVYAADGSTIVLNSYFERNINSVYSILPRDPGAHKLVVKGCTMSVGSSAQNGITLYRGSNISISDIEFFIHSTATDANGISVTHNVNQSFWQACAIRGVEPKYISGNGKTMIYVEPMPGTAFETSTNQFVLRNAKTLADAVATKYYTFNSLNSGYGDLAPIACKLRVWASKEGYGKAYKEYAFVVAQTTQVTASTPVQVFDATDNTASANWTITVSASLTTTASTVEVYITGDTGGTLGAGTSNVVYTELELLTATSYPYLTVN